jgi:DNA-binding PadR family transcriptional regulator
MSFRDQIRKGSTETLLLLLLTDEPMYGYQISQELDKRSNGYFEAKEGLLYPTLHRMQKEGLIDSEWRQAEGQRRRKYYTLTRLGREQLHDQRAEWQQFMVELQKLLVND